MITATAEPVKRYQRFLEAADVKENLKGKAVRGAAVTVTAQGAKFLIRFGSTAILARLLTPNDYGLVAMASVVAGFVGMFKDAGLTTATVQRKDITHDQVSMLFWINLLLGLLIALILVALSPAVSSFYGEPRLTAITCALAASFVFGGLTLQHQALLRRRMQFRTLAVLEIVSSLSGIAVGIAMAAAGCGYWSLVGVTIISTAVNAAGVWMVVPWKPALPKRGSGAMPLIKFGGDLLVFDIVYFLSRQVDMFLLGRFWGAVPLALYEKGNTLLMQPIAQINAPLGAVVEPALARVQSDPGRFRRLYLSSVEIFCSLSLPLVVAVAVFAEEVVSILLGPTWKECVPIFRYLAPAAALATMMYSWGFLAVSLGHSRKYRQAGMVNAGVIIAGFLVGMPYGPTGVAACYSATVCLLMFPTWWYITKGTPVTVRDVFKSWASPVAACAFAAAATILLRHFLHPILPGGPGTSFVAWFSESLALRRQLPELLQIQHLSTYCV